MASKKSKKSKQDDSQLPTSTVASDTVDTNKQAKKKKKNAPDKPQPAWLFPPDEENPILNGKKKSAEEIKEETQKRLDAIKRLKYKAVSAPNKTQPPSLLLQLVGAFLGEFGFNHTGRIYTLERKGRVRIAGWDDEIGKKFPKDMPSLVQIFRQWHGEWELARKDDSSSSEGNSEEGSEEDVSEGEEDVSSDSDDSDDSDRPKAKQQKKIKEETKSNDTTRKQKNNSSSTSSSDSESEELVEASKPKPAVGKPTVNSLVEKLKARQNPTQTQPKLSSTKEPDLDSGSESDSESSSSEEESSSKGGRRAEPSKTFSGGSGKAASTPNGSKGASGTSGLDSNASSNNSSDSSSSDSDSEESGGVPTGTESAPLTLTTQLGPAASDSSHTLISSPQKDEVSTSSDSSASTSTSASKDVEMAGVINETVTTQTTKRKRSNSPSTKDITTISTKIQKKNNIPFQRVASNTRVDPKFASNKYIPYDYAQRAHEDLIVTKGKGFTKEKNKKKRGSYRGGQIDISGGKGVKFDD